jgi:hypothetical protein
MKHLRIVSHPGLLKGNASVRLALYERDGPSLIPLAPKSVSEPQLRIMPGLRVSGRLGELMGQGEIDRFGHSGPRASSGQCNTMSRVDARDRMSWLIAVIAGWAGLKLAALAMLIRIGPAPYHQIRWPIKYTTPGVLSRHPVGTPVHTLRDNV